MKLLLLIFSIFFINIVKSKISATSNFTANFIIQDDCYLETGCNIINTAYWDNKEAFDKSQESTFIINNLVIPIGKTALLIISNSLIANQLQVTFPTSATISLNLNSSVTVNGDCKFTNVKMAISTNNGSIMSGTVEFVNSKVALYNGSSISTTPNIFNDVADVTIDVDSMFSLYDTSSLIGNTIVSDTSIMVYDNARIQAVNIQLLNGIEAMTSSSIKCNQMDIIDNGDNSPIVVYNFVGGLDASTLITSAYNPNKNTTITLGPSVIGSMQLFKGTTLKTLQYSNSLVSIGDAVIDGDIIVEQLTSIRISPVTFQTVVFNGQFTIMKNTTSYLSNITFPSGSIISPIDQGSTQYSNIIIEEGTIDMQDGFSIYGSITLKPDTTLLTINQLILEKCIISEGTVEVTSSLVCPNGNYEQLESGSLILHENTRTYIFILSNNGLIDIVGQNVLLSANVESEGVFQIQPDCYCEVHGYMDLFYDSILDIGGIGPNTAKPALSIYNSLRLNGTLNYNISAPPTNMDSIYYLIDSNIALDGNFSEFIPTSPSFLEHYNIQFSFVVTTSSGNAPGSLEIHFNFAQDAPKKSDKLWIALGITIPTIVIAILAFGIYRYRKSHQYKDYKQLSDGSNSANIDDQIFNNHKDNDDL
ncbi:hypothetical protein ACTA71_008582 [Dictyostelium dimigraforme]